MQDKEKPLLTMDTEAPATATNATTTTTDDDEPKEPWYTNWKNWLKIGVVLIIVIAIILAIIFNQQTGEILSSFLDWMSDNLAAGSLAYIAIYWFCTVMFIPGSILTLGAGGIYAVAFDPFAGVFLGTLVVWIGASLGASTAFLLGRFVFRDAVASYKTKYEKFDTIDKVVEQQGFKVTVLLRLSPIIPFSAFNYFMGLTGVSFRNYCLAHVGMLPGTLAYCYIGSIVGNAAEGVGFSNPIVLVVTIVGTIIAVIGMVYISYVAKKEFAKIAAQQQSANDQENPASTADGAYQPPTDTETNASAPTDEVSKESSPSLGANQ